MVFGTIITVFIFFNNEKKVNLELSLNLNTW